MSSLIRVGFVGLSKSGWASIALAPTLLKNKDTYDLVAVSTRSASSAEESAEKCSAVVGHPVKAYHGNSDQIANDPNVDLVVIAVKAPSHHATILPVIEAGKDVFIEWPAGANLNETIDIAQRAAQKKIRSIVGLQGRHSVVIEKVKEIIDSGKIGKITSTNFIALIPQEQGYWGPVIKENSVYVADPASGATMIDIALGHQMDSLIHVLGDFASVSATARTYYRVGTVVHNDNQPTGKTLENKAPDHVAFTGILKSGAIASITMCAGHPSTPGRRQLLWEIDGELGTISMEGDAPGSAFINIKDPKLYLNGEQVEVQPGGMLYNLTSAWKQYANGKHGTYATLDDAVKIRRLLDAVLRSAKEECTIKL